MHFHLNVKIAHKKQIMSLQPQTLSNPKRVGVRLRHAAGRRTRVLDVLLPRGRRRLVRYYRH